MSIDLQNRILTSKTTDNVNNNVVVAGWVSSIRDHGQLIFIDLRDWEGKVQVVINPEDKEIFEIAKDLGNEYVISVEGKVVERDESLINDKIPTGKIEIEAQKIDLINKSKTIPFPIDTVGRDIDEALRFKYRYIDLRRERLQKIMKARANFILAARNWLSSEGFLEVQTPLLTSTSPEGARDFAVPSRLFPGEFFVLPQAPQQYKQLLMISGVDKYYQIAPCARDEDPRADRHSGVFYQIDVEMSFPTIDKIFASCENLLKDTYVAAAPHKKIMQFPFPRIPFDESIRKYGTDKPDIRYEVEISEITQIVKGNTDFNVFNNAPSVHAIAAPGGAEWTRKEIDEMEALAKREGAKGLAYTKVTESGFDGGVAKFIQDHSQEIIKQVGANVGDLLFFGADKLETACKVLGKVRVAIADKLGLKDPNVLAFAWITEFPMYEMNESTGKVEFGHNPFSLPLGGMKAFEEKDPLKIKTSQYDLAFNGYEILSGSIRNHDPEVLVKAFDVVGYDEQTVIERFGGLYNAFQYGAPSHGGFAIGIDRFLMEIIDEPNIRDVYAFPKSNSGQDLMMGAPSPMNKPDLDILGIELKSKGKKVCESIKTRLEETGFEYEVIEHQAVTTSEEAAQVRGSSIEDGVKAMVLQSKSNPDKFIQVLISASQNVDVDEVSQKLGEDFKICPPELMIEKTGVEVGGVPPFGYILGLSDVYMHESIATKSGQVVFNAGLRTVSIKVDAQGVKQFAKEL